MMSSSLNILILKSLPISKLLFLKVSRNSTKLSLKASLLPHGGLYTLTKTMSPILTHVVSIQPSK